MKIYLMTDMEGVAGILSFEDWCVPGGRYYEKGKALCTQEANAAIEGFFNAGADQVVVADGHGRGGIDPELLDPRAELMRGWPEGYPLLLDETYDAIAFVGQHAKAGAEFAHIAHTQGFSFVDLAINGKSIGEVGQFALCAAELGVPCIFLAGDKAACLETRELIPGVETASVKRGTTHGAGDGCSTEEYARRNLSAVHMHPQQARENIRKHAGRALRRLRRETFGLVELPHPPFERLTVFRADERNPRSVAHEQHPSSIAELMNLPYERKPVGVAEPREKPDQAPAAE